MSRQRYPQIRISLQSISEPSQTNQEVECGIPLSQEESNSENLHITTSGSEVSLDSSEHELLPSVYTRQTNRTTANAKIEDERIQRILKDVYDKIVPMIANIDTQVRQIKSQMEDFSNQIQQIHEHLSSKVGDQRKIIVEGEPPKETGVWNQCVSNPIIERLIIKDEQGKSTESDSTLGDTIDD